MIDLSTSLRLADALLMVLLVTMAVAWRRPRLHVTPDLPSQAFGYANWLRWFWFVLATALTLTLLVAGTRVPLGNALTGLALAIACSASFVFCSLRVVVVRSDAIVFVGLTHHEIPLARIRELVEMTGPRGGYDVRGRRLFSVSDNLHDVWQAVGRIKQGVADGTVIRQSGMGSGERVVSRLRANDRPME
jgi:hypothetical protein